LDGKDSSGGGNLLLIKTGGILNRTKIRIDGRGNQLCCSANLHCCEIIIEGSNNVIEIGTKSELHAFNILVKGTGCKVTVGNSVTSNGSNIICMGKYNVISIGDDCMLSGQIEIWNTDSHYILDIKTTLPINPGQPIRIGNHVWIGQHATILKGVTIGDHAIVGMNSVVTKNIPSYSVCAGNPAKVRKEGVSWNRHQTISF